MRDRQWLRWTTLGALALWCSAAFGDVDYFAVGQQGTTGGTIHVFTYDTVAKSVSHVTSFGSVGKPNTAVSVAALPGYGIVAGESGSSQAWEGVSRWITADKLTWTNDLAVDMAGETGTGEFFDTGVRVGTATTDTATISAAMLKDESLFVVDSRSQGGNRYYGVGNVTGQSGVVSAIFPSDAQHLGNLVDNTGTDTQPINVAGTIEGTANRFAVSTEIGTTQGVMVYNNDGTFKGSITRLGGGQTWHDMGNFKSSDKGDLILQINGIRDYPATIQVDATSVADVGFNTQAFVFSVPDPGTVPRWIQPQDVDGTESGLIVVLGQTRGGNLPGADGDVSSVQFFESADGITWTPTTQHPFRLQDVSGVPAGLRYVESVAALYAAAEQDGGVIPEPAGLSLVGLGLMALRRKRR